MTRPADDGWTQGGAYARYMGRWSAPVAVRFVDWLDRPAGGDWIDVGCGTGVLSRKVLEKTNPASVLGIDGSEGFVGYASGQSDDARLRYRTADARALPLDGASVDIAVSGLVLNFLPLPVDGLAEMRRVTRPGGMVAFYVWDYPGGGMGLIDAFWQAAKALDPAAAELDESARFPTCTSEGVAGWMAEAGLADAEITAIDRESVFADFDDFWQPFTIPVGPAPHYAMSLPEERRLALRDRLAEKLGPGEIRLPARAWAAKARR